MEDEHAVEVEIKSPQETETVEGGAETVIPSPEGQEAPMPSDEATAKPGAKKEKGASSIKDALKQAETFAQTLSEALQGRGNVVMVRVNDEALAHLDMLVEAEITKSRSESAAFLINEGINANEALFSRISAITDQIAELREKLRHEVKLPSQGAGEGEKQETD
ncbi:MAG: hypothetical protein JXC32_08960 [Anaerolineae bacterium]|nr:hypothetical protein [Anaerolineae bacterium]